MNRPSCSDLIFPPDPEPGEEEQHPEPDLIERMRARIFDDRVRRGPFRDVPR